MHIVITRPKEDSLYLIENLIKLGHVVTHLPVIKIEKLDTKKIDLLNYQAIIFTSSNAIRFMNIEKFNSKIKCFCVGKATELTAKQVGFIKTYTSEGTVDSLIELIIRTLNDKSEKLLYLSSEFISKDLDKDLINAGYLVDRISNYTSIAVDEIDKKTLVFFAIFFKRLIITLLTKPLNNKKIKKIPSPIIIWKISIPRIPFSQTSRNKPEKFINISII